MTKDNIIDIFALLTRLKIVVKAFYFKNLHF